MFLGSPAASLEQVSMPELMSPSLMSKDQETLVVSDVDKATAPSDILSDPLGRNAISPAAPSAVLNSLRRIARGCLGCVEVDV
jgi:hypothetical protein